MSKKLVALVLLMLTTVAVVACGGGQGGKKETLYFFTWSEYIDPKLYTEFEEEYGIAVIEDTFSSNEDLFAKLQAGSGGYDVIVPSDYMVAIMIENNMLAELDKDQIPNIQYIDPMFTNPPYDPGLKHCLPYLWGTTGLGYNIAETGELPNSWAVVFDPEFASKFAGRISMLDDVRETVGAALFYLGYSSNTTNMAELQEARDLILSIKPYLATFDSDAYEDNLLSGEVVIAHGYSGNLFIAADQDPNIHYLIPQEGATIWTDNLCIPADVAKDPERMRRASLWINFLHRPENMARLTEVIHYASPNAGAFELVPDEIKNDPAIYPDAETMARLEFLEPLGDATMLYDRIWTEISVGQ